MKVLALLTALSACSVEAFNVAQQGSQQASRRDVFQTVAGVAAGGLIVGANPLPALASGGATAGKYT